MFLVLFIGAVDAFMTYFRVFNRNKASQGFLLRHIRGVAFGFLKFILYFMVAAVLLSFEND
jgi:hypothetical protein